MNTWIRIFCLVWCLGLSPSFSLWAEAPDAQTSETNTEAAKPEVSKEQSPQAEPTQPPAAPPEKPVRDVFQSELRPLETQTSASPDQPVEIQTNLEGLSMAARGSRAVINGEVYKEGEEKLGIKVLEIRKKEVDILINQSIQRTLSMLPGETKDVPFSPEEPSLNPLGEDETADTLPNEGQIESEAPAYV
jgi:hypothetical protein